MSCWGERLTGVSPTGLRDSLTLNFVRIAMNTEAASAGTASATGVFHAEPFTHTPRPAYVAESYRDQRYFGADSHAATCGIRNNSGGSDATATVSVERIGRMPGAARLAVDSMLIDGATFAFTVTLRPDQLRELARCLIDAAADIEAE